MACYDTIYISHYHGPRKGKEMHIVILDNGRSDSLASKVKWELAEPDSHGSPIKPQTCGMRPARSLPFYIAGQ